MMLKKSKEEVLEEIRSHAYNEVYNSISYGYNSQNLVKIDTATLANVVAEAVSRSVTKGFQVLLDSRYTSDDFEQDMTLK